MTKIIGLTGGIGSGKTTVAKLFENLGVPIYIADFHAKEIMKLPDTIALLKKSFDSSIFVNGKLETAILSNIVFNNPIELEKLNNIVHPLVKKHFEDWLKTKKEFKFIIKEAAILFESGSYKYCDTIVLVTAPLDTRINRIISRDGISRDLILKKIASQWTDEKKILKSHFVIENVDLESTRKQVGKIFLLLND